MIWNKIKMPTEIATNLYGTGNVSQRHKKRKGDKRLSVRRKYMKLSLYSDKFMSLERPTDFKLLNLINKLSKIAKYTNSLQSKMCSSTSEINNIMDKIKKNVLSNHLIQEYMTSLEKT